MAAGLKHIGAFLEEEDDAEDTQEPDDDETGQATSSSTPASYDDFCSSQADCEAHTFNEVTAAHALQMLSIATSPTGAVLHSSLQHSSSADIPVRTNCKKDWRYFAHQKLRQVQQVLDSEDSEVVPVE